MMMKRIVKIIIASLIIGILLNMMNNQALGGIEAETAFVLGYISYKNMTTFIITVTVWIFPQLLLFMLFGDYFEMTIIKMYSCIRCRVMNTRNLVLHKFAGIIGWITLFYIPIICITIVHRYFANGMPHINMVTLFIYTLIIVAYYSFILIIQNTMSLLIGSIKSIISVTVTEVIMTYMAGGSYYPARLIPTRWVLFMPGQEMEIKKMIICFSVLIVLIGIIYILCIKLLNNMEDI